MSFRGLLVACCFGAVLWTPRCLLFWCCFVDSLLIAVLVLFCGLLVACGFGAVLWTPCCLLFWCCFVDSLLLAVLVLFCGRGLTYAISVIKHHINWHTVFNDDTSNTLHSKC